ncbi:SanA/YdcF family protein [Fontimonas thermophila]|uniref:SanA/YdcF family protein n=1 Tax=Fontimonas thermophila TaxID=1076937 RepID=UPI000B865BE0|nr:ElyC/SanA/YdcF family protein [Fontimonas thermophila]
MKPSTRRLLRRWIIGGAVAFVLVVLLSNRWVINSTDAYVFKSWALLPFNDVGLVLGTSKYLENGRPSPEFRGRIEAAAELYRNGKVKHLIVSGANPDETYNEPRFMYQELVKLGVPERAITMDFAGFRTLDSIVRAQAVFGLDRFTVITQRYHSYRAVFIGRKLGLNVVAYLAPATSDGGMGMRNPPREIFARTKAVLDIFLLRTSPRFLGEPQPIRISPEAEQT